MTESMRDEVAVEGGAVPVFVAGPAEGAGDRPGLVVVPSIFGANDDLRAQMRSLSDVATTVILDPFWRAPNETAANVVPYADHETAIARINGFDFAACMADMRAVADWTKARTNGCVAALGICFGGSFVLLGAAGGSFSGVVTWHGSRMESVLERVGELEHVAMRLHFGSEDPITPPDAIDALSAHFVDHPDCRIVVHDGARHGFSHEGAAWDPDAAAAGMVDLREVLVALG